MSYVKVRHGCDDVALVVFAAAQLGASYGSGKPLFFNYGNVYCFFNSHSHGPSPYFYFINITQRRWYALGASWCTSLQVMRVEKGSDDMGEVIEIPQEDDGTILLSVRNDIFFLFFWIEIRARRDCSVHATTSWPAKSAASAH